MDPERPGPRPSSGLAAGLAAAAIGLVTAGAAAAPPAAGGSIENRPVTAAALRIPYEKYELPNGLTVVLHQDHHQPTVVVNVLVKVGSRHEEVKRTGFAHLFEHLMFMGTDRVPTGQFDQLMEAEGGWNNAWTSNDRTNYYEVAPSNALPLLLWLEADRLSALGTTMTLEKLEAQRKVVRNERRQTSENEPYGKVELRLPELLYPKGHPYHHPVIGSHEDLEAAQVADVRSFFEQFYVPKNMTLVLAGDFEPVAAKALVAKYFGALPSREPPKRDAPPPVTLPGEIRDTIEDNVELGKVIVAWHSPAHFAPGDAELDLAAATLERGKASRLYKALVYDRPLAQSVSAYQASQDLGSYFAVEAIARPGVALADLEKAMLAEVDRLVAGGVTQAELDRAKNQYETSFVARLQSLQSRASSLATYESSLGEPDSAQRDLDRYLAATPATVHAAVEKALGVPGRVVIHVVPATRAPGPSAPPAAPAARK
jgi:predicted Zn-dependent peptidase